ncbi:MAG: putative methyltransferase [Anaerosolibacter sp.]|uniref:class I SAM-dependent methyltransferase n=1 Tax=Anaerosolibacter sp. TaxID=1872527 RepID=UPI0026363971|nr:class I SAM-dependent methyltransferase [Anaerosolibacter sp.]MDF2548893.1 putative methyltransferase [Anaerosolibacter sp.]
MIKSKEWDWERGIEEKWWSEPSEDVYYYLHRWKDQGFKRFLDLGCGLGRHAILFAHNGFEVEAMDLAEKGLEVLRQNSKTLHLNIGISLGDMNHLPYTAGTFDCLLAYHVISHTDSSGIKNIIGEINRVLVHGGEFFITLCSKESPSYKSGKHPIIDENTILKTEGPEIEVPHFYCDLDTVKEIISEFETLHLRHIQDIYENTYSWHYFVHGKKKDL